MTITIGGSEIAAVLNEGYGCSRALFYRKTGVESEKPLTDDNPHIKRGKDMEPIIVKKFEKETGYFVELPEHLGYTKDEVRGVPLEGSLSWQKGHADGIVWNEEGGYALGILECKAPADRSFKSIKADGLPIDYILQLQYYMALAEVSKGYFAIHGCGENWEFIYFPAEADKELQDIIMNACQRFIDDVVVGRMPEQLGESDKRCNNCEYQKHCRGNNFVVDTDKLLNMGDDPDLDVILAEYEASKQVESDGRKAGDKSKEYRDLIKDMANGYSGLETRNYQAIIKVENGKTSVDAKKLAKIAPLVYAEVTKKGDPIIKIQIQKKGE